MGTEDNSSADPSPVRSRADPAAALHAILNRHGYGFHYALAKRIAELGEANQTNWAVEAAEVPVITRRGDTTHVDLVLCNTRTPLFDERHFSAYRIVAECKRVNPAYVDWCFVRVPQVSHYRVSNITPMRMRAERIRVDAGRKAWVGQDHERNSWRSERVYGLGFAIKGKEKGDDAPNAGGERAAIDSAVKQVLQGTNGFLMFLAANPEYLTSQDGRDQAGRVIPVVFTTAHLWTADTDLRTATLDTGSLSAPTLARVDWLWLQQNASPDLQHGLPSDEAFADNETLDEYLARTSARTVAIVSWTGLEDFLNGGFCSR